MTPPLPTPTDALARSASLFAGMVWETWWALVVGFTGSGLLRAFVSRERVAALLGDDGPRSIGLATAFGTVSSSCSYAAVSTTRTLVDRGASMAASVAFLFSSTDLVLELGLVVWLLLGWEFLVGEYVGGLLAVLVLVTVVRRLVPPSWIETARLHARAARATTCPTCGLPVDPATGVALATTGEPAHFCSEGCLDSHRGALDSPGGGVATVAGWRRAAAASVAEWETLWRDVAVGFALAAVVGGVVPATWWSTLFGPETGVASVVWATVVAVLVGVATTVCSVGRVPLALVFWRNGVPFGAVLSFVYADLLVLPVLDLYRRHYGVRMAAVLAGSLAVAAVVAGVAVHYLLTGVGLTPPPGAAGGTLDTGYTTPLNLLSTPLLAGQVVLAYGASDVSRRVRGGIADALRALAAGAAVLAAAGRVALTLVAGALLAVLGLLLAAVAVRIVASVTVDECHRVGRRIATVDGPPARRAKTLFGVTWRAIDRIERRSVVRLIDALGAVPASLDGGGGRTDVPVGSRAGVVGLARLTVALARVVVGR